MSKSKLRNERHSKLNPQEYHIRKTEHANHPNSILLSLYTTGMCILPMLCIFPKLCKIPVLCIFLCHSNIVFHNLIFPCKNSLNAGFFSSTEVKSEDLLLTSVSFLNFLVKIYLSPEASDAQSPCQSS